jgi:signal transduction histidine kinase
MFPSTRRRALLYVSNRSDRTDVLTGVSADSISIRSTAALATDAETPAADWVVIDAEALEPTKPSWLDGIDGDVYVLAPPHASVPEWVTDAGIAVLDPALAGLVAHIATARVGEPDDTSAGSGTGTTVERLDHAIDPPDVDPERGAIAAPSNGSDRPTERPERPEHTDGDGDVGPGDEVAWGDDDVETSGGARPTEGTKRTTLTDDVARAAPALDGIDLLSVVPFPIAFLDDEGVVRRVNRAWTRLGEENGRLPGEADVGVDYLDACTEADDTFAVSAAKAIRRVIDGESDSEQVEYPCQGRATKRWFNMHVVSVDGVESVAVAVVHYDVSHYKQRISVLDRVLRHNLRNKANIILGHAAALAGDRDDETATAATTIGAAARELLSLSEQARRYREVSTEDRPTTPVDMVSVVNEVTERLSERYPDAVIETSLPAAAVVRGTQSLSLVVHELVENAIVHNDRAEPWVRVDVGRIHEGGDEWFSLRVVDDGPSIPEQDRRLLTGGLEEHPVRHGSQLGVWVVSSLVTSLEGKVTVEPRPPRGKVVTATFPSVAPEN